MGALGVQIFPDHKTCLGIKVCRRKALDSDSYIEITRQFFVNEIELVRSFPDVSTAGNKVPALLHPPGGTGQLRSANVETGKACGGRGGGNS